MKSRAAAIRSQIQEMEMNTIFFADDFGMENRQAVRVILSRLVKADIIVRLAAGIYLKPRYSTLIHAVEYTSAQEIAAAIAQKERARIAVSGADALHQLGLSTQVPTRSVFLTDGSPKNITLADGRQIILKRTAADILSKEGVSFLAVQGDITSHSDRKNLLQQTIKRFGRVDVLVNNAGMAPPERNDILQITEISYDIVMNTNTMANLFMTQLIANQMIAQEQIFSRKGTIVNVSSCSAAISSPKRAEYCVSRAGVSMLTMVFADRLASEGILVHEIRPGVIRTDMTSAVTPKYDQMIVEGKFPIARWGTPEDVANVAAFLVSDEFSYSTGNYIDVDGGYHIKSL